MSLSVQFKHEQLIFTLVCVFFNKDKETEKMGFRLLFQLSTHFALMCAVQASLTVYASL